MVKDPENMRIKQDLQIAYEEGAYFLLFKLKVKQLINNYFFDIYYVTAEV